MRVALVLYGEILSPVVASQTFPLARTLRARGHEVGMFVLTSPRRWLTPARWAPALEAAREACDGQLTVLTHAPRHRRFGPVSARLARALGRFSPDVVHARQSRGGLVAGRAAVAPVVLDLRGLRPEEYLLSLGREERVLSDPEREFLASLRREDEEARSSAAATVCVSEGFRRHLGGGDELFVVPNAAEPVEVRDRAGLRDSMGLATDETAFVYSGSLAEWQCVAEACRLFAGVRAQRPGARLALLTHDPEEARRVAERAGVRDAILRRLSPAETRTTLPAFDAALLLRRPSVVNRVAAPVKFAEYLHAGLPVILTEGIGDASGQVRERGLGVVLPDPDHPANVERVLDGLDQEAGERGRAFAREHLTFDATAPRVERAYEWACGGRE